MLFRSPDQLARFTTRLYSNSRRHKATPQIVAAAFVATLGWGTASVMAMPLDTPASKAQTAPTAGVSYYLTQRIAVTTREGIRSLDIGTEVTLVKRVKNGMIISLLDGTEWVVSPGQLTQDAALAQQLADQDRGKVAAIAEDVRARAEARASAESARRDKEVAAAEDYVRRAQNAVLSAPVAAPEASRPWGLKGSALDEKPKVVATVKAPKKDKK